MAISFLLHHDRFYITQAPNFIGKQAPTRTTGGVRRISSKFLGQYLWKGQSTASRISSSDIWIPRAIRDRGGKLVPHCQQPLSLMSTSCSRRAGTSLCPSWDPSCSSEKVLRVCVWPGTHPWRSLVSAHSERCHCSSRDMSRLPPKHTAWEPAGSLEQWLPGQEHPIDQRSANSDLPCQPCTCQKPFAASLVIWEPSTRGVAWFHTTRCGISSGYHSGQHLAGTKLPLVEKKLCDPIPLLYRCQLKPKVKPRRLLQFFL